MPITADRCKETTTTTGTGTVTLAGAVPQFQSFASAFSSAGAIVQYAIVGQTGVDWEVGLGTFNGTTSLSRDTVIASSNGNAAVSLASGTRYDVFATLTSRAVKGSTVGNTIARARGWDLA